MLDIATRVYNHSYKFDPIIRSVLDNDFYKLLMLQMIWKLHKDTPVTFQTKNRTKNIKLAKLISEQELREQLDHVRTLSLTKAESIWLRGNTFYGKSNIFSNEFITWLETFRFPEYDLQVIEDQYVITFKGKWSEVSMWEIPCLAIINELRNRNQIYQLGKFDLDVMYAKAKTKLWNKLSILRKMDPESVYFKLADFGTRRRHSFLWQEWCVEALKEGLPQFNGTSNVHLAMKYDLEAIGTNAHELPMVYSTFHESEYNIKTSIYDVLYDWEKFYDGNLKIILPDTYGSTFFFNNAPRNFANWKGVRIDSKNAFEATDEIVDFWIDHYQNLENKLIIYSDGLDVLPSNMMYPNPSNICDIIIYNNVRKYTNKIGFGWGTLLTNDFRECYPNSIDISPVSLVCKVVEANSKGAVKLSDNLQKAIGTEYNIQKFEKIFGISGIDSKKVIV